MTNFSQPHAQRRLRVFAATIGLLNGVAWGNVGVLILRAQQETTSSSSWYLHANSLLLLLGALPALLLVGAFPGDFISRKLGRKTGSLVCLGLIVLGSLLQIFGGRSGSLTGNYWAGLALLGIGLGGINIILPKILHELAARGHRRLLPGARAFLPAGAGIELGAAWVASQTSGNTSVLLCGGLLALALALVALGLQAQLPESPHWYIRRGKTEQAHASLVHMHGELEGAAALDWVKLDAETRGAQQPLGQVDLGIPQIRETVLAGLVLEMVQALPLGLAGITLVPLVMNHYSVGGDGSTGNTMLVHSGLLAVALSWVLISLLAQLRRGEHRRYLWLVGGITLAACATTLSVLLPRLSGMVGTMLAGALAVILVAAQYVLVMPACTGGIDALVPPWLLRSQRRASAVFRPIAQAVAVLTPVALLQFGVETAVVVLFGLQMGSLLLALLVLPRALRLLR